MLTPIALGALLVAVAALTIAVLACRRALLAWRELSDLLAILAEHHAPVAGPELTLEELEAS